MASTKRLDLFVTSGKSKEFVIDYAYDKANDRDNADKNLDEDGKKIYAHYYDITYFRDSQTIEEQKEKDDDDTLTYPIAGNKHMVFGDDALSIMDTLNKNEDVLIKEQFLRGYTDDVVIDVPDGTIVVDILNSNDNSDYNITLTVKDSLRAIARVENETEDNFTIVLYDGEAYSEDKVKLDCSEDSVTVNYNLIYE